MVLNCPRRELRAGPAGRSRIVTWDETLVPRLLPDLGALAQRPILAAIFQADLHRFRVKPTVFMPALPPLFDIAQLDHLLVGLSDGAGGYLGLGYLEHTAEGGVLRLISPVAEGPKALRLGSVRLEEGYRAKRVDLRNLFGSG